jgi:hypothetical protein
MTSYTLLGTLLLGTLLLSNDAGRNDILINTPRLSPTHVLHSMLLARRNDLRSTMTILKDPFINTSHPLNRAIARSTTTLNSIAVDSRCVLAGQLAVASSFAAIEVYVFDVEGVDVAGDIPEEGEADIYEKVGATAGNHVHTDGRN